MTHAGAPISQTQQLPQISTLQPTQNMKLEETKSAGLMDDAINSPGQDKLAAERERQRQREQERRRREAVNIGGYLDCKSLRVNLILHLLYISDGTEDRHELSKRLYGGV